MNVLIIGYGSIGQQHYKSIKKIKSVKNIKILTNDISVRNRITIDNVLSYNPDYIIISNRTKNHFKAFKFINENFSKKKVLIEKPLFEKFFNLNFKLNNTYYVGFNLRYHPVIVYLKKFLIGKRINYYNCNCTSNLKYWRKNVTYEKSNTACKKGGGALLELSHEFDYTNYLIGKYTIKKIFLENCQILKLVLKIFSYCCKQQKIKIYTN